MSIKEDYADSYADGGSITEGSTKEFAADTVYDFFGIPALIEVPTGAFRTGRDNKGKKWSVKMQINYGAILDVKGADDEDLDIYVGNGPFSTDQSVYVVDQMNPAEMTFDEHKCFLGMDSEEDVRNSYCGVFSDGSGESRIGAITEMSLPRFMTWISSQDLKQPAFKGVKSAMENDGRNDEGAERNVVAPSSAEVIEPPKDLHEPIAAPASEDLDVVEDGDVANVIDRSQIAVLDIPRIPKAPTILVSRDKMTGALFVKCYILSDFSYSTWRYSIENLIQLLYTAEEGDIFTIAINSPGGEVDLAARLASAIRATRGKVRTIAIGQSASCGCLIWAEGHERFVTPGCYLMQHMSSHMAMGQSFAIITDGVALVKYVRDVVFKRALEIGLITPDEVVRMTLHQDNIFLSAKTVSERTKAPILEKW